MTAQRLDRPLRASTEIAAPPADVWTVISDVRRTGEWSPECFKVVPFGVVRPGTWLFGLNRRGGTRWPTLSRIVRFEPDHEIGWAVVTNGAVWTYRLEPSESGTRLTETRETPDGVRAFARFFTRSFLGGQRAHDDELEAGMAEGLQRIKAAVEATAPVR